MADGAEMRASLLLTLEDQLSGGLTRLMETLGRLTGTFERLNGTVGGLHLGAPFDAAARPIDAVTRGIGTFNLNIGKLGDALAKLDVAAPFQALDGELDVVERKIGAVEGMLTSFGDKAAAVGRHVDEATAKVKGSAYASGVRHAAGAFTDETGVVGGALAVGAVIEPVRKYADYEATLRQIAITEGLSGAAAANEVSRLRDMFATDAQATAQPSKSIAEAFGEMLSYGIPERDVESIIRQHSMAATAYGMSPADLGPVVGKALLQSFRIPDEDIGAAISAMAVASRHGGFKVQDFSAELPRVAAAFAGMGDTGRHGADTAFAALETVMKGEGLSSSAAADVFDVMHTFMRRISNRQFARVGIDLPAEMLKGEHAGKTELDTILDVLHRFIAPAGGDPVKQQELLGQVVHNQQALQAILPLLQHYGEFNALRAQLDNVGAPQLMRDFQTALAAPSATMRLFDENAAEAIRTIGQGFVPPMKLVNAGLNATVNVLKGANDNLPILTHAAYFAATALAVLAAGAGAKSLLGPMLAKGAAVLIAGVGGGEVAAGAALVGVMADVSVQLVKAGAALGATYKVQDHPIQRQQVEIHVSADPGLQVHARQPGGSIVPLQITTRSPSVLVTGRE